SFLVLSPEFLVVSKLSYPNVHHPGDFQDILALHQYGCLRNAEYLSTLLMQTSLSQLIQTQDFTCLDKASDLQALVDSIYFQLVKRFLYWNDVNVDALNSFEIFVLLDM